MLTSKIIKNEEQSECTVYGVKIKSDTEEYIFDDISDNIKHAEIIDKMFENIFLPYNITERLIYSICGILTENIKSYSDTKNSLPNQKEREGDFLFFFLNLLNDLITVYGCTGNKHTLNNAFNCPTTKSHCSHDTDR